MTLSLSNKASKSVQSDCAEPLSSHNSQRDETETWMIVIFWKLALRTRAWAFTKYMTKLKLQQVLCILPSILNKKRTLPHKDSDLSCRSHSFCLAHGVAFAVLFLCTWVYNFLLLCGATLTFLNTTANLFCYLQKYPIDTEFYISGLKSFTFLAHGFLTILWRRDGK